MEKIVTEYSLWYLPLCFILGLVYAFILYYRESKNEYPQFLLWGLGTIRTLVVAFIAFLLLNPLIRSVKKETEKPVVIVLQDNSASIGIGKDSLYYLKEFPGDLSRFTDEVNESFEVRTFYFGGKFNDGVELSFEEQQTNIGMAFDEVYNRYSHKNVGAMVLLSDGINNLGQNPLYTNNNFDFPLYTVAMGDTSLQRDLIISRVNFNRIAYLDNRFPIEINVVAKKCKELSSEVSIERKGEVVYRKTTTFLSDNEFKTFQTSLPAEETGLQKYTVRILPVNGEVSTSNNSYDFYIDVLEDKQKILFLADAPHPDISAIKQAVADNINYELEDFLIRDFSGSIQGYNLVILHGLPSVTNNISAILKKLKEEDIPTFYILTKKTLLPLFNEQRSGLALNKANLLYNEAVPYLNTDFNLFSLSSKTQDIIGLMPPLITPYGNLQMNPSAVPFLYQQIGSLATEQPQWIFNQTLERKTAVILGPGIWKWRIKEFSSTGSFEVFNEVINKTIQFLALRVDKSLFRVYGKTNYAENVDIEFEAELYNDVYELINDKDVNITITGSDGTNYPYTFTTTSKAYYLNAGNLPSDNYNYTAQVTSGGNTLNDRGEFSVSSTKLENLNTEADHNLLYNLAQKYGGEMVYPYQLDELAEIIKSRDDIKAISYYQKRFSEILNLPWLLALILSLLTIEWFARKRAGGY